MSIIRKIKTIDLYVDWGNYGVVISLPNAPSLATSLLM